MVGGHPRAARFEGKPQRERLAVPALPGERRKRRRRIFDRAFSPTARMTAMGG